MATGDPLRIKRQVPAAQLEALQRGRRMLTGRALESRIKKEQLRTGLDPDEEERGEMQEADPELESESEETTTPARAPMSDGMGLDPTSRAVNEHMSDVVRRRGAGEKYVRAEVTGANLYALAVQEIKLHDWYENAKVSVTQLKPGREDTDMIFLDQIPDYDDLLRLLRTKHWRGCATEYYWQIIANSRRQAGDRIFFQRDERFEQEWSRNIPSHRSQFVGTHPQDRFVERAPPPRADDPMDDPRVRTMTSKLEEMQRALEQMTKETAAAKAAEREKEMQPPPGYPPGYPPPPQNYPGYPPQYPMPAAPPPQQDPAANKVAELEQMMAQMQEAMRAQADELRQYRQAAAPTPQVAPPPPPLPQQTPPGPPPPPPNPYGYQYPPSPYGYPPPGYGYYPPPGYYPPQPGTMGQPPQQHAPAPPIPPMQPPQPVAPAAPPPEAFDLKREVDGILRTVGTIQNAAQKLGWAPASPLVSPQAQAAVSTAAAVAAAMPSTAPPAAAIVHQPEEAAEEEPPFRIIETGGWRMATIKNKPVDILTQIMFNLDNVQGMLKTGWEKYEQAKRSGVDDVRLQGMEIAIQNMGKEVRQASEQAAWVARQAANQSAAMGAPQYVTHVENVEPPPPTPVAPPPPPPPQFFQQFEASDEIDPGAALASAMSLL